MTKTSNAVALRPLLLAAALASAFAAPTQAASFNVDGVQISLDSILTVSTAVRTSARKCQFIGQDNGGCASDGQLPIALTDPNNLSNSYDIARLNQDDGNLNFKRGQVYSAQLKGVHDLYVKDDSNGWSGLLRAAWFVDGAATRTKRTELDPAAKKAARSGIDLLDAYVSKSFEIDGQPASVRAGNQVLSWGESLFIPGGIDSINALDLRKAHQPGTQLKEIFLPAPILSGSFQLGKGSSFDAFIQAKWNAFKFDAPGTFFSTSDVLGPGGRALYFPTTTVNAFLAPMGVPAFPTGLIGDNGSLNTVYGRRLTRAELADPTVNPVGEIFGTGSIIDRVADNKPGNANQYGFAYHHKDAQTDDAVGLYYYRYSDKVPFASLRTVATASNPFQVEAFLDYGKKRDLFGASLNTLMGEWSVGMEASYRPREGVALDPTLVVNPANPHYCNFDANPANMLAPGHVCKGYVDTQKWQFQMSGLHIMSRSGGMGWLMEALGASGGTVMAEGALAWYPKLKLHQGIPYAVTPDEAVPTRASLGFVASMSLAYPGAFGTRATLSPDITWSQGVHGISASALPGFIQGAGAITLGLGIDFKNNIKARLDITQNFGGGLSNLMRDRNFATFNINTAF